MEDLSNEILSDIEKDKIAKFCEDEFLFEAVKKYVLTVAYVHGVPKKGKPHKGNLNYALNMAWGAITGGIPRSDEELGQNIRALAQAVQLVESGFKELKEFKKVEKLEDVKSNPSE